MTTFWQVEWRGAPRMFEPQPRPHTTGPGVRKAWFDVESDALAWVVLLKQRGALEVVGPYQIPAGVAA